MQRLQFELALDINGGHQPLSETLREAALSTGVDLLFVLPSPTGHGITAVVRLLENGRHTFLQIVSAGDGYAVSEEEEMEAAMLGLARASADLFERMSTDSAICEPLSAR